MFRSLYSLFFLFWVITPQTFANYPQEWWVEIPRDQARSWEILPQDANEGEVILSKRTELGIFSNFSYTPFCLKTNCNIKTLSKNELILAKFSQSCFMINN